MAGGCPKETVLAQAMISVQSQSLLLVQQRFAEVSGLVQVPDEAYFREALQNTEDCAAELFGDRELSLREALKTSEDRAAQLTAENREAASLFTTLSECCDKQAKRNDDLQEQLRSSRVEAQELREEMLKMREELHHAEARRLKELPKLKSELKQRLASQAEYHLQEVEEEARRRVAAAERHFHEQVRELEAQLDQARETNAQLGRKCFASYQATAQAEGTSRQSQFQSHQLQQDLQMLHGQCFRLQQEVQHQKALLHQEEATAANFKAQLERAESMAQHSEKASRELQEWMVRSLNEVNLSAHPSGEPRGRQFATEPSRAEMLESFRKGYQVRNGHGNRIRSR